MTATKLLNFTSFWDGHNDKLFLNYKKNRPVIEAKATLYENFKFIDEQNLSRFSMSTHYPANEDLKFYEYLPFELSANWVSGALPSGKKQGLLNLFAQLKQYQLKALYSLDEATTIKQAKELLLIPLIDKLLHHKNIIATIIFLNRTSTTQISLELFLFCPEELSLPELAEFTSSTAQTTFTARLLSPQNCTYWYYRVYCELYLNSNVLSGSCSFLPFTTHNAKRIVNTLTTSSPITTTKEYISCFVHLFNYTLTSVRSEQLDFLDFDTSSHLFLSLEGVMQLNLSYSMALDTFYVWDEIESLRLSNRVRRKFVVMKLRIFSILEKLRYYPKRWYNRLLNRPIMVDEEYIKCIYLKSKPK